MCPASSPPRWGRSAAVWWRPCSPSTCCRWCWPATPASTPSCCSPCPAHRSSSSGTRQYRYVIALVQARRQPWLLVIFMHSRKGAEKEAKASLQFYRGKSYSGLEMELTEMQSCSNRGENDQAAGNQTAGSRTGGIQTATAALWKYGEARFYQES